MFANDFDAHYAWRREQAQRLQHLIDVLAARDLLDVGMRSRIERLQRHLLSDKVMVAFVAEFSRGKSELINAVFFAGYGRRIMPASAGRTTMCPTELGYDPELPPCLRLLPIETRLQPQSLMEWRTAPERWKRIDLDVNDAEQLAQAIDTVSEVQWVPVETARALGFWHDERPDDNPPLNDDGLVEVPRWRHAMINMAHPLLKQGLVVLDTPGLNAIGAEPELTMSLLPMAEGVVFVLAADAGVSKSDLAIWREHLAAGAREAGARLVVLNKVDVLWDDLSAPEAVQAQIERQRAETAHVLGLPAEQVIAVSAQKGLLAKVRGDEALLEHSRLLHFERALADKVLLRRRDALGSQLEVLRTEVLQAIGRHEQREAAVRDEQIEELEGLRGKNAAQMTQLRRRIEQEQQEFDAGAMRIQALRSVHMKLLRELFGSLSAQALQTEVAGLSSALHQSGLKLGVRRAYQETFARLHARFAEAQRKADEVQAMLRGAFRNLNAEFGFSLQVPGTLDLSAHAASLREIEVAHADVLSLTNAWRLAQAAYAQRVAKAILERLKRVFDEALEDVETWNKAAAAQVDAQLRERRRHFAQRLETIQRLASASEGLEERLADLRMQQAAHASDMQALRSLVEGLIVPEPAPTPASSAV
ncbi:dynamin family protein [Tepidimonas taiwanensis]|uniref:Dynamin family protein n=1 Tax=Tepidimonas taiwanensis TaxID=307486 RepID=A0A554X0W1_9BURK|nr:dynamin family protein [Tepidimonas taiwanensis]MDM7463549.1 dynamin family protein [Tepidimonas taiwanensis]TSE29470.1 Dynamin family protein [Tepidimonas taiwanensis]UBQ05870.1 dynamin family protein [Tepidimonas taiwanensis]